MRLVVADFVINDKALALPCFAQIALTCNRSTPLSDCSPSQLQIRRSCLASSSTAPGFRRINQPALTQTQSPQRKDGRQWVIH